MINDFIGDWDWGGTSTGFRFEAVKNQKIVKTVMKGPMKRVSLQVWADHYDLKEEHSYDVAAVRIRAVDENGNILNFYNEPVCFEIEGEGSLIGPDMIALQGGMGGTYVKSAGISGKILLKIHSGQAETVCVEFTGKYLGVPIYPNLCYDEYNYQQLYIDSKEVFMAINKAMRAALAVLSYSETDN